jgi:hypothetical protein
VVLKRLGEVLKRLGERLKRLGEALKRVGERLKRLGEVLKRLGECLKRLGEVLKRLGELLKRLGEVLNRYEAQTCYSLGRFVTKMPIWTPEEWVKSRGDVKMPWRVLGNEEPADLECSKALDNRLVSSISSENAWYYWDCLYLAAPEVLVHLLPAFVAGAVEMREEWMLGALALLFSTRSGFFESTFPLYSPNDRRQIASFYLWGITEGIFFLEEELKALDDIWLEYLSPEQREEMRSIERW